MGEAKRKRDRIKREANELVREMLASGEWKLLIDGDKHYAVTPEGDEFEVVPQP